jgi:biofilm PGA synthesis N-glycosyltransferase PgaC
MVLGLAASWLIFSTWWSLPWFLDLGRQLGSVGASILIASIALIPGFFNSFLLFGLMFDRRPRSSRLASYPSISILIAAYNEEKTLSSTIESIFHSRYPGEIEVLLINDGSTDGTSDVGAALSRIYAGLKCIGYPKNHGKAHALNFGLSHAQYELVISLDADSFLYKDAITRIVERYKSDPPVTAAVAGTVLVRNSRDNWLTQAQEWEYFHGIATVKRVQSLFHGVLVAQGAFSLYEKRILTEVGGWPDTVGEDIVMTWGILERGYRIGYAEDALAFTISPNTLLGFYRQRQRWARGMIEAFKAHPKALLKARLSTFFIYWDLLFPVLDVAFIFGFVPGLVLAAFGNYAIVGPMTLSLLPLALLINWTMFRVERKVFIEQGLTVRNNTKGFLIYTLPFSLIVQSAAIVGYLSEALGTRKSWGTK